MTCLNISLKKKSIIELGNNGSSIWFILKYFNLNGECGITDWHVKMKWRERYKKIKNKKKTNSYMSWCYYWSAEMKLVFSWRMSKIAVFLLTPARIYPEPCTTLASTTDINRTFLAAWHHLVSSANIKEKRMQCSFKQICEQSALGLRDWVCVFLCWRQGTGFESWRQKSNADFLRLVQHEINLLELLSSICFIHFTLSNAMKSLRYKDLLRTEKKNTIKKREK